LTREIGSLIRGSSMTLKLCN